LWILCNTVGTYRTQIKSYKLYIHFNRTVGTKIKIFRQCFMDKNQWSDSKISEYINIEYVATAENWRGD
jgi:hypothetical protein